MLSGWGLGFYEMLTHGTRIIGHGGDTQWFHNLLWLVPEDGLGVFVSYNTDTGGAVTDQFRESFLDRYYPAPPPSSVAGDFATTGSRFEGSYLGNRRAYTTFLTGFALSDAVVIRKDSDSTLAVTTGGDTRVFTPIGPLTFADPVSGELLGFREGAGGRITHAFFGELPMMAFERVGPGQDPGLHLKLLGLGFLVSLAVVLEAVSRLFRRGARPPDTAAELWARRLLVVAATAVVGFGVGVATLLGDPTAIIFGTALGVVLALPVVAALATTGGLIAVGVQWARRPGPLAARLSTTVVAAVIVGFLWSLSRWNLLGWRW